MSLNLKFSLILLLIVSIYIIFKTIKAKKLSMKFGLYWTIIFILMLILILFPNIIETCASLLGFKEAPNMLFLIAIFLLFYLVFSVYANISKINENNKNIIQDISILEYDLKKEKGRKK